MKEELIMQITTQSELEFNVKFLLLRAGQLADVFTATIADLNTNVTLHSNTIHISTPTSTHIQYVALFRHTRTHPICFYLVLNAI